MEGNKVFISMEPSPVDGIFKQDFGDLISKMTFADLIIFGMWNYKDEGRIAKLPESIAQYKQNIQTLREFGARHNIKIHIKSDTLRAIGELPPKTK
ncbi:Uncharacterised protein [uncultured archaeon]|nr:Uncharacterised protein [uncultured archaeon]